MEWGTRATFLHLKITAWHDNSKQKGDKMPFLLADVKKVLIPRQALLKKLDLLGILLVPEVHAMLAPNVRSYQTLVL